MEIWKFGKKYRKNLAVFCTIPIYHDIALFFCVYPREMHKGVYCIVPRRDHI